MKKIIVFSMALILVMGAFFVSATKTKAGNGSITFNSGAITLFIDADTNGIANVGDTISVTANITNTDGDGADPNETTVTADLSEFGCGGVTVMDVTDGLEGGTAESWGPVTCIISAGLLDVGVNTQTADITYSDLDDAPATSATSVLSEAFDNEVPAVTSGNLDPDANDSCMGIGGECIVDDGMKLTWDNTGMGDNNSDVVSVEADISNFGGINNQTMYDDGTNGDSVVGDGIWTYQYTVLAGTNDGTGVLAVTVTDDAGNVGGGASDPIAIDNWAPTIVSAGTVTLTNDTNGDGIASIGDEITYLQGTNGTVPDTDSWTIDLSAYGLSATTAPGTYPIVADDDDNVAFTVEETVTDNAGNYATTSAQIVDFTNIDDLAPVLDPTISLTSNNSLDTTLAKAGDRVRLRFVSSEELSNILIEYRISVGENLLVKNAPIIDTSDGKSWDVDFYVDPDDPSGPVIFTLNYQDLAGNPGVEESTADIGSVMVDTASIVPSRMTMKTQSNAFPAAHDSVIWYNYPGDTFEAFIENDGSENFYEIRVCVRSLKEPGAFTQACSLADFNDPNNYISSGTSLGSVSYTFTGTTFAAIAGANPLVPMAGYSMNVWFSDYAGNITMPSDPSQAFVMVYNVDPTILDPMLDNLGTTDWTTIDDFTDVLGLTFRAEDSGNLLGEISFATPVDLTDMDTVTALQDFAENVMIGGGDAADGTADIGINATALAALDMEADITISVPGATTQPGLIVYDDSGDECGAIANDAVSTSVCGDDISDIAWDGLNEELTFGTTGFSSFGADTTVPTVAVYSPTDGSTSVTTTANLTLIFSEDVQEGVGDIVIYKASDDSVVETIDVAGALVTFDGTTGMTINPTENFSSGTDYYVQIDSGAILDLVGNEYVGISNETTWNFKTKSSSGGGGSYSGGSDDEDVDGNVDDSEEESNEEPVLISAPTDGQYRNQEQVQLSLEEKTRREELMEGTYEWQYITQSAYPTNLEPGEEVEVWVEIKNIGTATWFNNGENVVRLGSGSSYGNANQQRDYNSEFANPNWYSANRPANILHPEVKPGWHTRFQFIIKAPVDDGIYKAYFTPVIDGIKWMNDIGLYWEIRVGDIPAQSEQSDQELEQPEEAVSDNPEAPVLKQYTVQAGDYLALIAQKTGVSSQVLIDKNKAKYPTLETNPSYIEIGWVLNY